VHQRGDHDIAHRHRATRAFTRDGNFRHPPRATAASSRHGARTTRTTRSRAACHITARRCPGGGGRSVTSRHRSTAVPKVVPGLGLVVVNELGVEHIVCRPQV
jgi:hypothetical protein